MRKKGLFFFFPTAKIRIVKNDGTGEGGRGGGRGIMYVVVTRKQKRVFGRTDGMESAQRLFFLAGESDNIAVS